MQEKDEPAVKIVPGYFKEVNGKPTEIIHYLEYNLTAYTGVHRVPMRPSGITDPTTCAQLLPSVSK